MPKGKGNDAEREIARQRMGRRRKRKDPFGGEKAQGSGKVLGARRKPLMPRRGLANDASLGGTGRKTEDEAINPRTGRPSYDDRPRRLEKRTPRRYTPRAY